MHSPSCDCRPRMSLAVASRESKSIRLCLARRGSLETSPQLRGPSYDWRASHARKRRKFRRLATPVVALLMTTTANGSTLCESDPARLCAAEAKVPTMLRGTRQWRVGDDRDEHAGVSAFGRGRITIPQGSQLSEARRAIQLRRPNLG